MAQKRHQPDRSARRDKPAAVGEELLNAGGKIDRDAVSRPHPPRLQDPGLPTATEADPEEPIAPADDDAPNRVVFSLLKDLNKRLDKYLTDRIPFMSRNQLQRLIDEGGVTVNARKPKSSTLLRKGDLIEVFVPAPPSSEVVPQEIPLDVLYEDAHLIVLNKRPDIIVHPARSQLSGTLINALAFHFQNRSSHGGALSAVGSEFARPGVVHRLDRNTSGVIVFAKDDHTHWKIGHQFEMRTVEKRYLAITHGHYLPRIDVIDLPLGPHPSKEKGYREKYVVRHDELGKPSVTICRVLATFGTPAQAAAPAGGGRGTPPPPRTESTEYSLVELELKTGRTHQIRVHLSHLGFPIVADDMYGGRAPNLGSGPSEGIITRQALHATLLSFQHPMTGERLTFTAPLPTDMRALVDRLAELPPGPSRYAPPGSLLGTWADDLLGPMPTPVT